jgi:mannitol/fructose-specific phosphotransferase system IIA component (Ntr-type)
VDERRAVGENTAMSIAAFLDPKAVNLRLRSDNRDDTLRELVHLIPDLQDRAAEQITLWQSLVDREKLHTTAVGEGLAFPHARNAMGNLLKKPAIVIGRHANGIAWGATDGKPVQLFFLLAAPSLTEHLHLLSQTSRILRNANVREELLRADEGGKAIEILKAAEAKLAG